MSETFMKDKPVFPLLLSMALPMVVSMLVNSLYNIVDSFFVAKISEDAMTALSLVFPVQNLINAIAIGFGVGINAMISYFLGAGEKDKANTSAMNGLILSIIHGVGMMVICIAIMPWFLSRFTTDETVIAMGVQYATIAFAFSIIISVGLAFEKVFQAVGWMKISMMALMGGCVMNIIMDPVLIFGLGIFPQLGIKGAALATGFGQVVNLAIYLIAYKVRNFPVELKRKYISLKTREITPKLYSIGIPAMLNMALASVLITILNRILSLYSQTYVLVLGIYYKLQTFLYLPANGFVQGMRPIVGYNYGAGEKGRVKKIYLAGLGMNAIIMTVGTVICALAADKLIGLYSTNPETIAIGTRAFHIICIGFIVSAVSVTTTGAMEGLGKGIRSLIISLCRYVMIILPAAAILCRVIGPDAVWNCFWIAEAATAAIAAIIYKRTL